MKEKFFNFFKSVVWLVLIFIIGAIMPVYTGNGYIFLRKNEDEV